MRTDERRSVIGKAFEKPLFNQSPSVCKIIVTGWQRPHSMQVIGQNDPGVNMEGAVFSNLPHHASEYFDTPNEQVIRVAFEQVDGQEISSACYAITSIVRHGWFTLRNVQTIRKIQGTTSFQAIRYSMHGRSTVFHTAQYARAIAPYVG